MKQLQFSIHIHEPKEKVWDTLWQDATLREWAGMIDPGTHMVGALQKGNQVQFLSASGYGVTSLVEELIPGEFVLLRHSADTQDEGKQERDKQWTGGTESYSLTEKDENTTLTIAFDVPVELEAFFLDTYPKVMEKIKLLAQQKH